MEIYIKTRKRWSEPRVSSSVSHSSFSVYSFVSVFVIQLTLQGHRNMLWSLTSSEFIPNYFYIFSSCTYIELLYIYNTHEKLEIFSVCEKTLFKSLLYLGELFSLSIKRDLEGEKWSNPQQDDNTCCVALTVVRLL